ncbi:hypothetical protein AL507_03765 [Providencia stuartii]|nr:hypothetical protein AL507_03765 [Providencia stuartii]
MVVFYPKKDFWFKNRKRLFYSHIFSMMIKYLMLTAIKVHVKQIIMKFRAILKTECYRLKNHLPVIFRS